MSKKVLLIVLALLLVFCIIAAAVGGFLGWRYYSSHQESQTESTLIPPPPEASYSAPVPEAPAPVKRSEPAPVEKPARRAPPPEPAPSPVSPETTTKAPATEAAPAETLPPALPPSTPEAVAPQRRKAPKGRLGIIFESRVASGQVTIRVDGKSLTSQGFTATRKNRFRTAKDLALPPGGHDVTVTVTLPDGKSYDKAWTAMVVEGANSVWKVEMNNFPKAIVVKHIQ